MYNKIGLFIYKILLNKCKNEKIRTKNIPNHNVLIVWQIMVLGGLILISIFPLFTALWRNDSRLVYEAILYLLAAVLNGIILIFFIKKKIWAVSLVMIQTVLIVSLILYRLGFTALQSETNSFEYYLRILSIPILFGIFTLYNIRESIRYFIYLKNNN